MASDPGLTELRKMRSSGVMCRGNKCQPLRRELILGIWVRVRCGQCGQSVEWGKEWGPRRASATWLGLAACRPWEEVTFWFVWWKPFGRVEQGGEVLLITKAILAALGKMTVAGRQWRLRSQGQSQWHGWEVTNRLGSSLTISDRQR